MAELYDRRAILKIGQRGGSAVAIDSWGPEHDGTGFRLAFSVTKTVNAIANEASVDIWNLSDETRARVFEERADFVLEAGFGDEVEQLFAGQVLEVQHEKVGPDWMTHIEAGDGSEVLRNTDVSIMFPTGTTMQRVVEFLLHELALVEGDASTQVGRVMAAALAAGKPIVLARPLAVSGSVVDALNKLGRAYRFDWSVQDGQVQILLRDAFVSATAIVLTPESGLLGAPIALNQVVPETDVQFETVQSVSVRRAVGRGTRRRTRVQVQEVREAFGAAEALGPDERTGVSFKSLLIPRLRPGVMVGIKSARLSGGFRVEWVRFDGDTRSGAWTAEGEAWLVPGATVPGL